MPLSRTQRRLLLGFGTLIVVVLLVALIVPLFVDGERFRPWIVDGAKQATGRTLTFGEISLRLLPVPALTVDSVAVSESSRLPDLKALQLRRLSVRLGVLGLLRGKVTISSLMLDEPVLVLYRDAQGRWNYDDLLERAAAPPAPDGGAAAPGPSTPAVEISMVRIRGGKILLYDDALVPGTRQEVTIGPVDATLSGWGAGRETQLDLRAGLGESVLRAEMRISGTGKDATVEVTNSRLRAEDLVSILPGLGVATPPGLDVGGEVTLEGNARFPLAHPEAIRFAGELRLDGVRYRDASMSAPISGISGTLSVDGNRAIWSGFSAGIGDSKIAGQLQVEDFQRPRVGFALRSDLLDFDEVVSVLMSAAPGDRNGAVSGSGGSATSSAPSGSGILERTTGQGSFELSAARFQSFELRDLKAAVGMKESVFALQELSAGLYDGSLDGALDLDLSGASPRFRLRCRLDGVEVAPLAADYDPALDGLLRGRLSGTLAIEAAGTGMESLIASARGTGSLELRDGARNRSARTDQRIAPVVQRAGARRLTVGDGRRTGNRARGDPVRVPAGNLRGGRRQGPHR